MSSQISEPRCLTVEQSRRLVFRLRVDRATKWTVVLVWGVLIWQGWIRSPAVLSTGMVASGLALFLSEVWSGFCPLCRRHLRSAAPPRTIRLPLIGKIDDPPDQPDAISLLGSMPTTCGHCGGKLIA